METKKEEEAKKPIISLSELNILEKKEHILSLCYYHHFEDEQINQKLDVPIKTDTYYEFGELKNKELEPIFNQVKLNIKSTDKYGFLKKGKFYNIINDTCKIYSDKMILLNEIKFKSGAHIESITELNNNDLIILSYIKNPDYDYEHVDKSYFELLIYRINDNIYYLRK